LAEFAKALRVQFRVIGAIIVRELGSRHGGDAVGTFWLLVEPIFITLVIVVLHVAGGTTVLQSVPIIVILLTGYVPHLMYRHSGLAGFAALNANSGLLYHRQVHFLDLVLARLLVEIITVLIGFTAVYLGFYAFGQIALPHSLGYIYLGWFYHIWFIVVVCFFFTGGSLKWPILRRLFLPLALAMLFPYGAFFMLSWIPTTTRYYLLFFPPANATEIMRYGYFGDSALTFFSIPYTTEALIFLTFFSVLVLFSGRRLLEL
jgi:capsular polysaccharide transport system permease protein